MTTLAEFMSIAGADNRPPILEKSMYDSWKSRMELYLQNKENGRMILNLVQNGLLVWPTIVQEDDTTRIMKYKELSVTKKLQADCDLKATNSVHQGFPPDVIHDHCGADNCPPMLEKSMYDSWKSRMELYMENRENGRMILNSVQYGLLVWPTIVQEDDTTRTKKYEELSVTEKLQADCDLKATNSVLQGLPPDVYTIFNHHKVSKEI
ncbi:hypothetical protein Tco_0226044 [Tanacetum coccineum]